MQKLTDFALLWQEIHNARKKPKSNDDFWKDQATAFYQRVENRWQAPDSSRDKIISTVKTLNNPTLLDIGCGPGNFSFFIAPHCKHVISIDSSPSMLSVYKKMSKQKKITNTTIIQSTWEEVTLEPKSVHISYASHSMYSTPDIIAFVQKMNTVTINKCFLLIRATSKDAVMSKAATIIWNQPYDRPNFQIAYNALIQLGILADVTIETPNGWKPVFSPSIEEALIKIKTHFNVLDQMQYDSALQKLLETHLIQTESGDYKWPKWGESALISWNPTKKK